MKNIEWTSCKEFTIDLGKEQIEKYINMWELDPSWLYSLVFLEEKDLEFHKQYHYRTLWSIPTPQTPIPKATACVYFVITVSKIKPQSLPVEVYYVVEACRLRHRPGKTSFREKWLKDIIESKTLLQETINF
ncbi:A-kinase anchor protein 14 [Anguilla anguilla]|uniref:A-kinase anchor protein 14 n=1 Tax=Anguilla anguilla TaxID=7936 RepID=UPI0015ADE218|nr:A-kinase anchor protein 14 [Anguilla anguilla]